MIPARQLTYNKKIDNIYLINIIYTTGGHYAAYFFKNIHENSGK